MSGQAWLRLGIIQVLMSGAAFGLGCAGAVMHVWTVGSLVILMPILFMLGVQNIQRGRAR